MIDHVGTVFTSFLVGMFDHHVTDIKWAPPEFNPRRFFDFGKSHDCKIAVSASNREPEVDFIILHLRRNSCDQIRQDGQTVQIKPERSSLDWFFKGQTGHQPVIHYAEVEGRLLGAEIPVCGSRTGYLLGHVNHRNLSGWGPWVDSIINRQPTDISRQADQTLL